jgi:Lectin C-type domain
MIVSSHLYNHEISKHSDFFSYGKWLSACGTTFLFSKANVRENIYFRTTEMSAVVVYSSFQNTWAGAMRVCRSIGTDLLAVEYDDKDSCIAKLTKSNNFLHHLKTFSFLPTLISEHRGVQNLDYWTSGSQKECPGKMSWCSLQRPVLNQNLSWASNGDGDCVSVKYGPNATSTFTKTDCEKQLPFICEVIISCFLLVMVIKIK